MKLPRLNDTIAAIATASGRAGIGIVRISGTSVRSILEQVCGTSPPPPRQAVLRSFDAINDEGDSYKIDEGIVLYFPGPDSFTGEDVAEFHAHGSPVVLDLLLSTAIKCGARLARPGEFSERAFINGKIDLAQAEAISDLINSASAQAARCALNSLSGVFSRTVHDAERELIELRTYVEASIDFPDEEIDLLAQPELRQRCSHLLRHLSSTIDGAFNGMLLRDGLKLVIAGKPNAGKSSLMNQLAGRDLAIVTALPGTTRDLLHAQILIDGLPVHLTDTAGLRESSDPIELEGVRRARAQIRSATHLLLVLDASSGESVEHAIADCLRQIPDIPPKLTVAFNKCDLIGKEPYLEQRSGYTLVALSALSGAGIALLREHIKSSAGFHSVGEGDFTARRRHVEALSNARNCVDVALQRFASDGAVEIFAEELRQAHQYLASITGEFTTEDLLDKVFSSFCIGK